MTGGISPSLFDFIDELATGIRQQSIDRDDLVEQDSTALTFCESLFDQFFGAIGLPITGFDPSNKELAGTRAEEMRADPSADVPSIRRLIALYEGFCDMYADLRSDYGGDVVPLTFYTFHTDYLSDLLDATADWARETEFPGLVERVMASQREYHDAIENSAWLTRTTKSASVWRRQT